MGRKTITVLSLLFALVLCMSLIACQKSDDKAESTAEPTKEAAPQKEESAEPTEEEDTIKWTGTISVAPYMAAPVEEDVITTLLEEVLLEKYGYDVTFENVYIETSQYRELINLKITSDEAPDIFYPGNIGVLYSWYDQGAIASWDKEFFMENAPNVYSYYDNGGALGLNKDYTDMGMDMITRDGKMIAVLGMRAGFGPATNGMYNKAWLDNLGVTEVPYTLDDWYDLMLKFTNEDPDGNGENDTYGFSSTGIDVVFGAFGSYPGLFWGDYGHFYERDGELVSANTWKGNKDALAFLNEAYEAGVIDPEFITGENTGGYWAISHSFVNGRIGYSNLCGIYHTYKAELNGSDAPVRKELIAVQGEDADVVFAPYPMGTDGYAGGFERAPVNINNSFCYNANLMEDTEKLAAIMQVMDVFAVDYDLGMLAAYGIEGEHYELADNNGKKYVVSILPEGKINNSFGIQAVRDAYGQGWPQNEQIELMQLNSPASEFRLEVLEGKQMRSGYHTDLYVALPSESLYKSELQTLRDEVFIKMITGALPIEYWDTFVEEYDSLGGNILSQEANDWYNSK